LIVDDENGGVDCGGLLIETGGSGSGGVVGDDLFKCERVVDDLRFAVGGPFEKGCCICLGVDSMIL
jgi:hypothetical protein